MRSVTSLQTTPDRIKSRAMQIVEHRIGESVESALRRLYLVDGMTQVQIAEVFGVSERTLIRWMQEFGIQTRWAGPRTT